MKLCSAGYTPIRLVKPVYYRHHFYKLPCTRTHFSDLCVSHMQKLAAIGGILLHQDEPALEIIKREELCYGSNMQALWFLKDDNLDVTYCTLAEGL